MVERTRLLTRAIGIAEIKVRSAVRDMQSRRSDISSALRHCGKENRPDDAIKARQQICELDRLIARLRGVQTALETVLRLGAD
jgi:hypothetical protein